MLAGNLISSACMRKTRLSSPKSGIVWPIISVGLIVKVRGSPVAVSWNDPVVFRVSSIIAVIQLPGLGFGLKFPKSSTLFRSGARYLKDRRL